MEASKKLSQLNKKSAFLKTSWFLLCFSDIFPYVVSFKDKTPAFLKKEASFCFALSYYDSVN